MPAGARAIAPSNGAYGDRIQHVEAIERDIGMKKARFIDLASQARRCGRWF